MRILVLLFTLSALFASCTEPVVPKPHAYFRIDFPKKEYVLYQGACPFEFNHPYYSTVNQDLSENAEPCWLNLDFVPYNATLHLTYKPIGKDFNLLDLQNDTRRFVMNHSIKAQEIMENTINKPEDRVHGVFYTLTGNTATSLQFYVTDSTRHYLRGALYFNAHTNPDSIAPVLGYISDDVLELIGSMKWRD
jgi:gliding motility-associated lipoprotein GldD